MAMEHKQEMVALHLLHFTASKLAELYRGKPEEPRFQELITALEKPQHGTAEPEKNYWLAVIPNPPSQEINAGAPSVEDDQGKLPRPPEA